MRAARRLSAGRPSGRRLSGKRLQALGGTTLLAAALLGASSASGALSAAPGRAPAKTTTSAPCPPGHELTPNAGLDGGDGCRALHEVESPVEAMAALDVMGGPRAGLSGEDRVTAVAQYRAMTAAAQARMAAARTTTYPAPSGALVPDAAGMWKNLGPRPIRVNGGLFPNVDGYGVDVSSGRVSALEVDPRDATGNTVLMGAAAGGVWRTTNGGVTWTPIADTLPTLAVGDLGIDPTNGYLHVGTGEGNSGSNNYAGAGVYRSIDDGRTWTRAKGVPADLVTTHVEVAGSFVYVSTSRGLFRSADRGATYTLVSLPTNGSEPSDKPFGNFVTDVRVKPGDTDQVTAAVGWRSGGVQPSPGLYRSTDAGLTWTKLAAVGFGSASTSTDPIGRVSLAYAEGPEQDNNILWAVVQDAGRLNNENTPLPLTTPAQAAPFVNATNLNGVYRSGDDGATWTLKATYLDLASAPGSALGISVPSTYSPGVQAWYNNYVAVDPTDPTASRVYVGLEEVYEVVPATANTPGLARWTTVGRYWNACIQIVVQLDCEDLGVPGFSGLTVHADQHAMAFASLGGGLSRMYVGNDGGVWKQDVTAAAGVENELWTPVNETLSISQPYEAEMSRDGTVYAGLQDNGTVKITPDGVANEVYGGDGFDVAVHPDDSEIAYEEYTNGAIRVTQDGGVSWVVITPTGMTGARFATPFEMDPLNPDHLVIGGNQVFETTEGSSTGSDGWTEVFNLTSADVAPAAALTAVDVRGTAVYAGWCGLPPDAAAGSSACNITTKDGRYNPAVFVNGIATNVKDGCTRASGSSDCWHQVAADGLPARFISSLFIDPDDPKTVYATTAGYSRRWTYDAALLPPGVVFRSTDGGESFTDITGNLPQTFGTDLLVQGGRLILSTDVGVFSTASEDSTEWVPLGRGIPAVPAIDLSLRPGGKELVLATHGRGVWVLPLTGKRGVVTKPPVVRPVVPGPKPRPGGKGPLPATGLPVVIAAPLLLTAAAVLRRRNRVGS